MANGDLPHDRPKTHQGANALPQSGTVPFRIRDGRIELCLITARSTGQWGFPKGNIDPGENEVAAATRETWEEAGVRGNVIGEVAGYSYEKWGAAFDVRMYLLHVTEIADHWDERTQRQRALVDIQEARHRIDRKELHETLEDAYKKARHFALD